MELIKGCKVYTLSQCRWEGSRMDHMFAWDKDGVTKYQETNYGHGTERVSTNQHTYTAGLFENYSDNFKSKLIFTF